MSNFPYVGGTYVTYSEITGTSATEAEIIDLLRPLDARKTAFLLSFLSIQFELTEANDVARGEIQAFFLREYTDEDLFSQIRVKLGEAKLHERALVHPWQLLNVLRLSFLYSEGRDPDGSEVSELHRHKLGLVCLMMNDLLFSKREAESLATGSRDCQTAQLMTQMLPSFEAINTGNLGHVLHRALVSFRVLLRDEKVVLDIAKKAKGYDFDKQFRALVGVPLEKWVAVLYGFIAYLYGYIDPSGERNATYLAIDASVYLNESTIPSEDFISVLRVVARNAEEFRLLLSEPFPVHPRSDVMQFKSFPLVNHLNSKHVCVNLGFLVEKIYSGVFWALHDRESPRQQKILSTAWGQLFEHYVTWWINDRRFFRPILFFPRPCWDDGPECFDGAFLQDTRLVVMEYKGGFLSLRAKYSMSLSHLLRDLNKKIAKACRQLARNIGAVFGDRPIKTIFTLPTKFVTKVIPIIVVQDQVLRGPFVNWWINRQFLREMSKQQIRYEVEILPVTLIHIQEFEAMIDSAEAAEFDLISTIQERAVRDPEMRSDLADYLRSVPGYGKHLSKKREEMNAEVENYIFKYTFGDSRSN